MLSPSYLWQTLLKLTKFDPKASLSLLHLLSLYLLVMTPVSHGQDGDPRNTSKILRSVEARRSAIYSGRFHVRRSDGFNKLMEMKEFRCSVAGESWACRGIDMPWAVVNKNGIAFTYYEAEQLDGSTDKILGVQDKMDIIELSDNNRFLYSGSFWKEQTLEYMKAHVSDIVVTQSGSEVVLKLAVPKEQAYAAFVSLPPALNAGGWIEASIDLARGAIVTNLTFASDKGLGKRLTFSDFRAIAPGLYYPMLSEQVTFKPNGDPGYTVRIEIIKTDLINESIPDEDFEMNVAAETFVTDKRAGSMGASIQLNKGMTRLEDVIDKFDGKPEKPTSRLTYFTICLTVIILCIGGFFLGRRLRQS